MEDLLFPLFTITSTAKLYIVISNVLIPNVLLNLIDTKVVPEVVKIALLGNLNKNYYILMILSQKTTLNAKENANLMLKSQNSTIMKYLLVI